MRLQREAAERKGDTKGAGSSSACCVKCEPCPDSCLLHAGMDTSEDGPSGKEAKGAHSHVHPLSTRVWLADRVCVGIAGSAGAAGSVPLSAVPVGHTTAAGVGRLPGTGNLVTTVNKLPFLYLSLDLPPGTICLWSMFLCFSSVLSDWHCFCAAAPLFRDSAERNIIPQASFSISLNIHRIDRRTHCCLLIFQVPLFDLLAKFDGITQEMLPDGTRKR